MAQQQRRIRSESAGAGEDRARALNPGSIEGGQGLFWFILKMLKFYAEIQKNKHTFLHLCHANVTHVQVQVFKISG